MRIVGEFAEVAAATDQLGQRGQLKEPDGLNLIQTSPGLMVMRSPWSLY